MVELHHPRRYVQTHFTAKFAWPKYLLPFQSLSDADITTVCRESLRDIIQRFNVLDNFIADNNDFTVETNVKHCKYYNPHELPNIYHESDVRDGFSMLHVNIRSLNKNFDQLDLLINKFDRLPDIIFLSETGIRKTNVNLFVPSLDGYTFYRDDTNSRAGGSGIYVRNSIETNVRDDLYLKNCNSENIWLDVKLPTNKKLLFHLSIDTLPVVFRIFRKNSSTLSVLLIILK